MSWATAYLLIRYSEIITKALLWAWLKILQPREWIITKIKFQDSFNQWLAQSLFNKPIQRRETTFLHSISQHKSWDRALLEINKPNKSKKMREFSANSENWTLKTEHRLRAADNLTMKGAAGSLRKVDSIKLWLFVEATQDLRVISQEIVLMKIHMCKEHLRGLYHRFH